jgi:hypothetical protein
MKIGGQELPDSCPLDCSGKKEAFSQGGLCARCPLFNCRSLPDEDGKPFRLTEPDNYRPDWALAWKYWFENGMKDYPQLPLQRRIGFMRRTTGRLYFSTRSNDMEKERGNDREVFCISGLLAVPPGVICDDRFYDFEVLTIDGEHQISLGPPRKGYHTSGRDMNSIIKEHGWRVVPEEVSIKQIGEWEQNQFDNPNENSPEFTSGYDADWMQPGCRVRFLDLDDYVGEIISVSGRGTELSVTVRWDHDRGTTVFNRDSSEHFLFME